MAVKVKRNYEVHALIDKLCVSLPTSSFMKRSSWFILSFTAPSFPLHIHPLLYRYWQSMAYLRSTNPSCTSCDIFCISSYYPSAGYETEGLKRRSGVLHYRTLRAVHKRTNPHAWLKRYLDSIIAMLAGKN